MAGPRANLAVTKDGGTYNKLQRPDDLFDESTAMRKTNERKRDRAAVDRSIVGPASGNKRAKAQHSGPAPAAPQSSSDSRQYRSAAPVGECGMRMTLPIDEEEAQYSDDSMGEALAYLRSVRSEASAIPTLLIASTTQHQDADVRPPRESKAAARQRAFYQDGAWISVDDGHEAAYDKNHKLDNVDPEHSYYRRLIRRFEALRSTLNKYDAQKLAKPNAEASQASSDKPPSNRHEWLYMIDREYPSMAQISQLDEKSIRRGLEYCAHAMDRFDTISPQKSCWIWTLLALSDDIGTLDSEKISCIRELGNKAGEISTNLRQKNKDENACTQDRSVHADLADGRDDGDSKIDESISCDVGEKVQDFEPGYVRYDGNESTAEATLEKTVMQSQIDAQLGSHGSATSSVSCEDNERTNTESNDTALEQARARLLAQLGDNLVQAGMPASTRSIDETNPQHNQQTDKTPNDLQEDIQVRAIPSRAEAERQRQMMRMRDSATASTKSSQYGLVEPSNAVHSAVGDDSSSISDMNTRVTIDMILTVVAECYGQRDLLRFRKSW